VRWPSTWPADTPALGGICILQPVVDGGACPWSLECRDCDKFVISGATCVLAAQTRANGDSNWAEGATDDYVYRHFESRHGRAREELAGLGLLDQALALDLCKPPEYFHRIWSTASRANDRAAANPTSDDHAHNVDDEDR
jgi:hypothetical protein